MPLRLSSRWNCSKFNCVLYDFYIHVTRSQAKQTQAQIEVQRLEKGGWGWLPPLRAESARNLCCVFPTCEFQSGLSSNCQQTFSQMTFKLPGCRAGDGCRHSSCTVFHVLCLKYAKARTT